MSEPEHDDFFRRRFAEMHPAPEITFSNLSAAEKLEFERLRNEHKASSTTVLSWLEGRRYNPSKDPEFLEECAEVKAHLQAIVDAKAAPWRSGGRSAILRERKNKSLAQMREEDEPRRAPEPIEDPVEAFNLETAELFEPEEAVF